MPAKKTSKVSSKAASRPAAKSGNGLSAMPRLWLESLIKPAITFSSQKGNADWGHAFLNYAIAGALGGLLAALLYAGIVATIFPFAGAISFAFVTAIGAVAFIVGSLLVTLVLFVFAKIFGGKGSFKSMYYCMSLYSVPLSLVYQLPFAGWLAALYGIYLQVLAVRQTQEFTTARAVATVFIPLVLAVLVVLVLLLLVFVSVAQSVAGGIG
jgi:hypothetical protein